MAEASGSQDSANTRPNAVASSSNSTSNRPHEIALPPRPPHPSTSTSGPMSPSGDSAGSHSIESALGQGGSTRLFPMRSVLYPSTSGGVVSAASTAPTTAATASPASNSQSIASTSRQKVHAPPSRDGSQSVGSVRDETAQLSEEAVERLNASNEGRQPVTVQAPPLTVKRGGETDTSATKTGGSDSVASKFHMTARFEHAVSEDGGNWIITGRGGHLQKCEDEPIHAPGAIQAFGVLIAFDELDDGRLKVQQVSENSGFILGLPPAVLFKAKCLTDLLDPDEADALFDALASLSDSDPSPYNFQLSGFGMPNTSLDARHGDADNEGRIDWTCHAALHRPDPNGSRAILELELVEDAINPLTTESQDPNDDTREGLDRYDDEDDEPTEEDLLESTVSLVRPLRALQRWKGRSSRTNAVDARRMERRSSATQTGGFARNRPRRKQELDVVGLLAQINEQLDKAEELDTFLKVTAGIFKELTDVHRVMIYQFDEMWNGRVVSEQVDWTKTKDLFRGLNFPASDIPAQARELYKINKVRVLYDRDQPTARLCCRTLAEVQQPLDMTNCYLRAMSPIHIKYLANMSVRSSMSVSITAFGDLWGLVAMHTYGQYGHRVSFPVREFCKLLGDSVSRNIERLSYAKRLHARKLINTTPTNANPSGYIVAKAEDLLQLFDADFGVLSIGEEAKILGDVGNSQELLVVLEYLRAQQFADLRASQDLRVDFPDIEFSGGFQVLAGLLYVPLSNEGRDFIVFFRRGQLQEVHWAGNPYANKMEGQNYQPLEPRKSFKMWSETVVGKSKAWTDEQLETASVLCLVYGKFIDVWREKETALAANKLNTLLLANASHEVRTPLNAIINYLELALDGPVEGEVRENLARSHAASRSLIHVINDLLDLTRTEKGKDLYLQDPFDLSAVIHEATSVHRTEAASRGVSLDIVESPTGTPSIVIGDRARIKQIVTNVVANAVKHTSKGTIVVEWGELADTNIEGAAEHRPDAIRIGISVADTGSGISEERLEAIFRDFEQVSSVQNKNKDESNEVESTSGAVGLGLAVVARIVRNLNGQLRVESKVDEGSKFMFILPFRLPQRQDLRRRSSDRSDPTSQDSESTNTPSAQATLHGSSTLSRQHSRDSGGSASAGSLHSIDSLISAMSKPHITPSSQHGSGGSSRQQQKSITSKSAASKSAGSSASKGSLGRSSQSSGRAPRPGTVPVNDSNIPLRATKIDAPYGDGASQSSAGPVRRSSVEDALAIRELSASTESHSYFAPREPSGSVAAISRPAQLKRAHTTPSPPTDTVRPAVASSASDTDADVLLLSPRETGGPRSTATARNVSSMSSSSGRRASLPSFGPLRILVVEDEPINRMILQKRLSKDGHTVVLAEHGGVCMRLLEHDVDFDVVLLDLQMPHMNGYEASAAIRRLESDSESRMSKSSKNRPSSAINGRLPIIAVSASLPERQKGAIDEAGMDGWILKPVDFKRLNELFLGMFERRRRKKDVYTPGAWERGGWLDAGRSVPTGSLAPAAIASSSSVEGDDGNILTEGQNTPRPRHRTDVQSDEPISPKRKAHTNTN